MTAGAFPPNASISMRTDTRTILLHKPRPLTWCTGRRGTEAYERDTDSVAVAEGMGIGAAVLSSSDVEDHGVAGRTSSGAGAKGRSFQAVSHRDPARVLPPMPRNGISLDNAPSGPPIADAA